MSENKEIWAIVELMGHVKLAGKLTEEERFGSKLGRLDIPIEDGFVTQYFGGNSIYRVTPVTEAVARHVSRQNTPAPVSPWDFPKQIAVPALPASSSTMADPVFGFDDDTLEDDEFDGDFLDVKLTDAPPDAPAPQQQEASHDPAS